LRLIREVLRQSVSVMTLAAVIVGCGCASKPKTGPIPLPPAQVTAAHYSGTPLSGPMPTTMPAIQPQDAWSVKVTFIALEKMPEQATLEPISNRARLVSATRSGVPVVPSGKLIEGVKFIGLDDPQAFIEQVAHEQYGRNTSITSVRGALPPGVTTRFVAADVDPIGQRAFGEPEVREVVVEIARPTTPATNPARGIATAPTSSTAPMETLQLAISISDLVTPQVANEIAEESSGSGAPTTAPAAPKAVFQTESTLLSQIPIAARQQAALFIPFRFDHANPLAMIAVIEVVKNPLDQEFQQVVARCNADLLKSTEEARKRPQVALLGTSEWTTIASALDTLSRGLRRRPTLVFLADNTGANLTEDIAMVADDATIAQISDSVVSNAKASQAPLKRIDVGWMLDRSCLQLLNEQLANSKLPPELIAVLTSHAGEAGRHASSMEEIAKGASGPADMENRIIAENYIYLEDSSPASRVRAFDWLRAHNRAPADYDPLGPIKQRREALEKALAAPSSSASGAAPGAPASTP